MNWEKLVGKLVTDDAGRSAYRVISYCESPTVIIENLETKERQSFGIGGLTADLFYPLLPCPQDEVIL
jgi:hypothetical protein